MTTHQPPDDVTAGSGDAAGAAPRGLDIHQIEDVLQPIPEEVRTHRVSGQFWIWAGANIAPINWVLGALGIELGLGLRDTLAVLVIGNAIGMALFGVFVLIGQRTGVTGMVLSRAAFGRRGAYVPAAIQAVLAVGWCAVNTWIILDLVMALLGQLGIVDPDAPNSGAKIAVAAIIMAVQVTVAWFGYRTIATFERWTVPPTLAVLILMSVVAWFHLHIDWSYAGPTGEVLQGSARIAAMSAVMTVIGIGWGITWFTYACDYSRFVSGTVPPRKLYLASALGQYIPVVWLGVLGASLATTNGSIDPGELIVANFGALALPVLFLVIHGPIATNILNIYTFSVATQALDIKMSRRTLNLLVGVFAFAVVVFFIFQSSLATVLSTWLGGIVAWIASWAGIMLVHYFVLQKRDLDARTLFEPVGSRNLPDVNWTTMGCFVAGIVATWMFMYGPIEAMQGFGSRALGGLDLSWLVGGATSAVLYAVLGRRSRGSRSAAVAPSGVTVAARGDGSAQ
ncbi:cytosine permease [Mycolicibacterium sp. 018/SC-01/001]|uniref:purine-cytosine permease family protein n=1 Tax=Mycolicibacterium sp. 018/SC-01/001 TaxID=2592069 RepID=UPI00117EF314|nr:cytosine permease [Mycolicibacterium sp. 018/SC-01/001]TRW81404.1 cytosine permease [Mycolicibacterium sp. 018/SC-01/001]